MIIILIFIYVVSIKRGLDKTENIKNLFFQGTFRNVVKAIALMARSYPTMPLNIQISFCYSRFLDVHLYNILYPDTSQYTLYTTLAWKDMNSFCYQPSSSNKYRKYKTSVVPITLHRISRRCTDGRDRRSHEKFMFNILKSRGLDMNGVQQRIYQYRQKQKQVATPKDEDMYQFSKSYLVTYDSVSRSHEFVMEIVRQSDVHQLIKPVFVSHPTLASLLCPKRKVIRRIQKHHGIVAST